MDLASPVAPPVRGSHALAARYAAVRAATVALAAPLSPEDAMLQSMEDASPAKWHLAHTTWFFEHFLLAAAGVAPLQPRWHYLFNSYYSSAGPSQPRPRRGLLSRPSLAAVLAWREAVDARVLRALKAGDLDLRWQRRLELGLQHEQQHQELLLTDIKHGLWSQPLHTAYRPDLPDPAALPAAATPLHWHAVDEQVVALGTPAWPQQAEAFAYDNESPSHRVLLAAHALASRPVSNDEYRQFIIDGGYRDPRLWLSDGWARVQAEGWERPLYWEPDLEQGWTLGGMRGLHPHAAVAHLSYYEADAFARWAGARLPTEAEWERAARAVPLEGHFADDGVLEPGPATAAGPAMQQLFGDVWEWTASAYLPYPGFQPWQDDTGEYNAKFMSGQFVLRGGSCATPRGHVRASYRNFFPPYARWQFAGVRLARDLPRH